MKKPHPIHVVLADDHSVVREGLMAVISREPDIRVVAQARNWDEAIDQILQNRPEIAVLDLHMPGMAPADGVATIRGKFPGTQVVIFSAFGTHEEVYQVIYAGARGYVLKGESGRDDLLACIRAVSNGELWIHPIAAARLAERMTGPNLTPREIQTLRLMAVGKSNKEIGSSLDVTEGTVKVHINHILAKLGVTGRVEAIMVALQHGLVRLTPIVENAAGNLADKAGPSTSPHFSGGNISKGIEPANPTRQLHTKK